MGPFFMRPFLVLVVVGPANPMPNRTNSIEKTQGASLAVARSPNASENSGGRVKTLPFVVRRASQIFVEIKCSKKIYMSC